jgi:hypothetical protein
MSDARHEISKLIFTCDQRNDAGDFEGVGELFAHGSIEVEGMNHVQSGSALIGEQFAKATQTYPEGGARTHHISTNLIIEVDEDAGTATCQSHYVMYQQTDQLPLQPINVGRNFDRFERVDGTWQWKHRYITVLLSGNMTHHLVQNVTPFN